MLEETASYIDISRDYKIKTPSGDRVHTMKNLLKWSDVEESCLAEPEQGRVTARTDIMEITKRKYIKGRIKPRCMHTRAKK